MLPPPRAMAAPMAMAMAMMAQTVDSRPELMPESTVGGRAGAGRLGDLADRRASRSR